MSREHFRSAFTSSHPIRTCYLHKERSKEVVLLGRWGAKFGQILRIPHRSSPPFWSCPMEPFYVFKPSTLGRLVERLIWTVVFVTCSVSIVVKAVASFQQCMCNHGFHQGVGFVRRASEEEREGGRERKREIYIFIYICMYVCMYVCIYIATYCEVIGWSKFGLLNSH